jgi:folate-binding protein YgfZ
VTIAADRDLVIVEVTGPDRVDYLDDVTTQQFSQAPVGAVLGALVLDARGAPLAVAWALVGEEAITLVTPSGAADHVMDVVATRTFLAQVSFSRPRCDVTSLAGDDLDHALAAAGVDVAADSWVVHDDVVVARHAFGAEVLGMASGELGELGLEPPPEVVGGDELSIRSGEPRWGHEVVPGRLPEEYGLLATHVHLAKGCYPGQEPIAHMWMLGRPRRRLARVRVGDGAPADAVTGQAGAQGFAWVVPDTEPGEELADDVHVTGFVAEDREVVGWTPAQTRRRDRGGTVDLPRRQP